MLNMYLPIVKLYGWHYLPFVPTGKSGKGLLTQSYTNNLTVTISYLSIHGASIDLGRSLLKAPKN
jgi:lipid-binding SYLF domain-containing protein